MHTVARVVARRDDLQHPSSSGEVLTQLALDTWTVAFDNLLPYNILNRSLDDYAVD